METWNHFYSIYSAASILVMTVFGFQILDEIIVPFLNVCYILEDTLRKKLLLTNKFSLTPLYIHLPTNPFPEPKPVNSYFPPFSETV